MPESKPSAASSSQPPTVSGWRGLLERQPWLPLILPLAVFMVAGSLEPTPTEPGGSGIGLSIPYSYYPLMYGVKLLLVAVAIVAVLPAYARFRGRVGWLAFVVGALGAVVWIGLCKLNLEQRLLVPLGLGDMLGLGQRSAFNPFEQFPGRAGAAWGFLAVRFFGLAILVPVIEEFFLRGFVMRYVMARNWWRVPFGEVDATAVVVGTVVPILLHPAELIAAAVWFTMVTWLMTRTRNIWDCVVAHAVTNFLLGVYVVASGDWWLM